MDYPRTSTERAEEGCVDSKHVAIEDSLVSASNMHMKHAHGAMHNTSHAIEPSPTGVKSQKSYAPVSLP